ncbi:MAG TPA: hypothetical protein PLR50_05175, partial [Candidatus Rifleibacterium sp.]|nr:hypothetical protein [Candidatus Rifleibacterium sp.]
MNSILRWQAVGELVYFVEEYAVEVGEGDQRGFEGLLQLGRYAAGFGGFAAGLFYQIQVAVD